MKKTKEGEVVISIFYRGVGRKHGGAGSNFNKITLNGPLVLQILETKEKPNYEQKKKKELLDACI